MLIGDSVLLQKGEKIFRPSDVGNPVEVSNTWTLKFNNGAIITTTEDTEFKAVNGSKRHIEWISLANLSSFVVLGDKEPFTYERTKWDSVIELSDYTSKKGVFDLGNTDFARFAGAFVRGSKVLISHPNSFTVSKNKFTEMEYAKTLYPEGAITNDDKNYYFAKCWVDELIDALFNVAEVPSIPDDFLFKFSEDWVNEFVNGFCSQCYYDTFNKYYVSGGVRFEQLFSDMGIMLTQIKKNYQLNKKVDSEENEFTTIKFQEKSPPLSINDGYENITPMLLYDVGDGEFIASGVCVRS